MPIEHPLALELVSLKVALDKYQHAAYTSSLQLQRAQFDAAEATSRSKFLETENARLRHEVNFLRSTQDSTSTSLQVSELTLALGRMSDKLSITEDTLLKRTTELTHAISDKSRIQLEIKAVRTELDRARQREEAFHRQSRELEQKCKAAVEEAMMADMVVLEYADLVRSLERKLSNGSDGAGAPKDPLLLSSPTPVNSDTSSYHQIRSDDLVQSLVENRFSLQRLLHEFNAETSNLQAEIMLLHAEVSSIQAKLDSERENSELDRVKLAEALLDVDRCVADDGAATKIVSRYMQFSQFSIQTALETTKSRHATTLATMYSSFETLTRDLNVERGRAAQLRDALDLLTEDISRETFGRRREVSLRLQGLVREERLVESLRDWLRKAEERKGRLTTRVLVPGASSDIGANATSKELEAALDSMIQGASTIFESLSHEQAICDVKEGSSLAHLLLAEELARSLAADLEQEIEKRMSLTRSIARELFEPPSAPPVKADIVPTHSDTVEVSPAPEGVLSNVMPPAAGSAPKATPSSLSEASEAADSPTVGTVREKVEDTVISQNIYRRSPWTAPQDEENTISVSGRVASTTDREVPLFAELSRASHRYDELQRAFHDCHLTLDKLKAEIVHDLPTSRPNIPIIPIIQTAINRLDDFCEDTRVELEIRIADEERIIKGFETLLIISNGHDESVHVELELNAFLDGTDPSIVKTVNSCTSKLEDLQHDIAQVKRILHESLGDSLAPRDDPAPKTPPRWLSWTSPFISPSSMKSAGPAPSFGTVITTPQPRRVSSNSFIPLSARSMSEPNMSDPYPRLGLRIPMPSQGSPGSPLYPSRNRKTTTSSNFYLLGLGTSSGIFSKQDAILEGVLQPANIQGSEQLESLRKDDDVE